MKRRSEEYLSDILEAIRRIQQYVKDLKKEDVKKNTLISDAVLRNLEIIGEAVARLPEEVKTEHKDIPWRDIKDFRNVVAHHYFAINFERIWEIIKVKISVLEKQIKKIRR